MIVNDVDEYVSGIKPAKMVANNLRISEKESNKKVKLVMLSDVEVDKINDMAKLNNASNIKCKKK